VGGCEDRSTAHQDSAAEVIVSPVPHIVVGADRYHVTGQSVALWLISSRYQHLEGFVAYVADHSQFSLRQRSTQDKSQTHHSQNLHGSFVFQTEQKLFEAYVKGYSVTLWDSCDEIVKLMQIFTFLDWSKIMFYQNIHH